MSTITVPSIAKVQEPRGAAWAARAAVALWLALTRKRSEQTADDPLVKELAQVRAMARFYLATDPGFAADLMAAADRHEQAQRGC